MLLQEFETRSELLRKLQGAQENCNQKQQQELQKKIDELMPMVEKLQTDCAMLEERAKALNSRRLSMTRRNRHFLQMFWR